MMVIGGLLVIVLHLLGLLAPEVSAPARVNNLIEVLRLISDASDPAAIYSVLGVVAEQV